MTVIKKYLIVLGALFLCALFVAGAYAFEDGFAGSKKAEGRYTVMQCAEGVDMQALAQKLNMRPADTILAGQKIGSGGSSGNELSRMLDELSSQVSGILDMRLPVSKIEIKICRDNAQLKDIYKQMFNNDLEGRQSFYVYATNTIYVSEEGFKREIIGHEIAHAIISRYFIVPAPVKIQEILAMYVEYNLRRADK